MANNEAKQKAKELIEWFCKTISNDKNAPTKLLIKIAKQCAIKVCDDIIDNNNAVTMAMFTMDLIHNTIFYKQVKKEIEKNEQ